MSKDKAIILGAAVVVGILLVALSFEWGSANQEPAPVMSNNATMGTPEPRGNTANPNMTPPPPVRGNGRGNMGNLNVTIPTSWKEEAPASSMRLAQYSLPALTGDTENAELAIFDRIGGSVDQNLDRWYGQFKQPDGSASASHTQKETFTVSGMPVTLVSVKGTYSASSMMMGMGGAPMDKPGYGMLAAIVVSPEGPYYFKMTGPAKTVDGHRNEFRTFINSVSFAN